MVRSTADEVELHEILEGGDLPIKPLLCDGKLMDKHGGSGDSTE